MSTQIDRQFDHLKKQIEKDPYTALFGPRREPFLDGGFWTTRDGDGDRKGKGKGRRRSWGEFWGAVLGDSKVGSSSSSGTGAGAGSGFGWMDVDGGDGIGRGMGKGDRFVDTTAKSTSTSTPASATTATAEPEPEHRRDQGQEAESEAVFDPITGRMVSKARVVDHPDDGQVEGKDVLQKSKTSEDMIDPQTQHDHLESPDKPKEFVDPDSDSRSQSETADANEPPGVIMAQPPENQEMSPEQTVKSEKGDRIHTSDVEGYPETATPLGQPPAGKESLKQEAEDLEFLNASDIRASYDSSKPELDTEKQKQETRRDLEEEFDSYVDPAGRINAQEIRSRYDSEKLNTDEPPATPDPSEDIHTESTNQPEPPKSTSTMYRILAYDSSTLQVTSAETSSSGPTGTTTEGEDLHPTDILARLNNPAKFLPHFASMHNDGYEIVSGGGDILVFKRVRTESAGRNISGTGLGKEEKLNHPPPPEYEYDHPPESGSTPLPETQSKPKKQTESTSRKIFRRMFLAGSATAATCYAVGVVSEYFRTGGQGGYGIDGFTEFESERRRRD